MAKTATTRRTTKRTTRSTARASAATLAATPAEASLPNGAAAAALLAGGVGAAAMGLTTILNEAVPALSTAFRLVGPVGPLSGKTTWAVIIWLAAWGALAAIWNGKEVDFAQVSLWSFILLGLGLLGTFPPVFLLFAAGG